MNYDNLTSTIIMADDDDDDYLLTTLAFKKAKLSNPLERVVDGQELINNLNDRLKNQIALPAIILLDLNMPKMDGREALSIIRANDRLKHIPIIILTTSQAQEDILNTYQIGCNSYIRKPVDFTQFVETITAFKSFFIEIVELPK